MTKTDVLDQLFEVRDRLSDLIIELSPKTPPKTPPETPEERAEFDRLVRRRDGINGLVAQVIATAFQNASADLAHKVDELEAKARELGRVQKNIEGVKHGIQIADDVVMLVGSLLKLVAAL